MAVQLEQRIDVRKVGPNRWRLVGLLGKAIFFYGEAGAEQPPFSASNEFKPADVGNWRAVDSGRGLIIGHSGMASINPKKDGKPGEVEVTFTGVNLAV